MRYSNTLVHYSGKINEEKRKIFWNKKWNSNQNLLNTFKNLRFYFSCFESCVTSIKEDSGFQVRDGNLKWKAISMTEGTIHVEHTCDNSSAYRFWRWNYLSLLKSSLDHLWFRFAGHVKYRFFTVDVTDEGKVILKLLTKTN